MQDQVANRIFISGRVQGVFFRVWTSKQANALGVSGWVRNMPDGSVEIFAQGEAKNMSLFTKMLRRGPKLSKVEKVLVKSAKPAGASGFKIV